MADAAQPAYEMLGAQSCNAALPQNLIVRELSFGRFITLADSSFPADGPVSGIAQNLALPLHFINVFLASRAREPLPYKVRSPSSNLRAMLQATTGQFQR